MPRREEGRAASANPRHGGGPSHLLQRSKTKCANVVFVSDSFQGNCMQTRLK